MHSSFSSSPGASLADTAPNRADGKTIAWIPIFESDLSPLIAFCCWQQKSRMLWRRETAPKRHGRACPAYPRVSAQRTTARGGEVKKALFLRASRPRAAAPGLVSGAARRGWAGQTRPGRGRLPDEAEAPPQHPKR